MPEDVIQLNIRKPAVSVVVILLLIASAGFSYLALNWYIGNTLAENFAGDESDLDVGKFAITLSPKDPLSHWRLGLMWEKGQPITGLGEAIPEYAKAATLSPNDYRFWISLGIAQERAGDPAKGEHALRKAISLAPSYAQPHWYLGNLLVRSGKYDEAFTELRRASDANSEFTPPLFNLVWGVHGTDYDGVSKALDNRPELRGSFARYLVNRWKFEEGLRVWSTLTPTEKSDYRSIGEALVGMLVNAKRFYDAMNVWNDIAPLESSRAAIDQIVDPGFEDLSASAGEMAFSWQVRTREVQVDIDPGRGHTGHRSLRMIFQIRSKLQPVLATDLVPIRPNAEYDLQFYVKSEKLSSGATPVIQVINASDFSVLASSPEAPNGDKDWQLVTLPFKTPPQVQAVLIQVMRGSCADTQVCPIFGTLWYDDFSIKRRN